MSAAKKRPAATSARREMATGGPSREPGRRSHAQRSGAASAVRQNALATGPVSESRTRIGAKAIAQPPASRQRKATRRMEGAYHIASMPGECLSAIILLLLVVDPFGNVPVVNTLLADVPITRRRRVIVRECGIAFMLLAAFMLFGPEILAVMHLSETSLSIAGGV